MTTQGNSSAVPMNLAPESKGIADWVIRRASSRRVALAWVTLSLWIAVAVTHVGYYLFFFTYIYPIWISLVHQLTKGAAADDIKLPQGMSWFPDITVWWAYGWAALVLLAAGCTLLYVSASRRATLCQVQAGLAAISEQLRLLAARQSD